MSQPMCKRNLSENGRKDRPQILEGVLSSGIASDPVCTPRTRRASAVAVAINQAERPFFGGTSRISRNMGAVENT